MRWTDEGIFLTSRKFGETSSVVSLFTRENGRHLGLVHGGLGRKLRPVLQVGNLVHCEWNARSVQRLGRFRLEMLRPLSSYVLDQPLELSGITSTCALIQVLLPERDSCTLLFDRTTALLESIVLGDDYMAKYVLWELELLRELGFGLSLDACVVTGVISDLSWVSPKSGAAVSMQAGEKYAERLLPLPDFIINGSQASSSDISDGLRLTGHFLSRLARESGIKLSSTRSHFVKRFKALSMEEELEKYDG